jgi:hypothetical protein
MRYHEWSEPEKDTVRIFWKGASAAEIAKMLGDGFTRNMVIGAARRLKLPKISHAERLRRIVNGTADARAARREAFLPGVGE